MALDLRGGLNAGEIGGSNNGSLAWSFAFVEVIAHSFNLFEADDNYVGCLRSGFGG
jgi:hypothetical protein